MKPTFTASIILIFSLFAVAQERDLRYKKKNFELSFFPGISTNGLESGHYLNKYSFNLTSGFSAGTQYFSLAGISNINTQSGTGLQIAGLANVVGSNSYLNLTRGEEKVLWTEQPPDFKGIHLSGLINFVRNDSEGIQVTGGFNITGGNASGFQWGFLGNLTGIQFWGVQLASLFNFSRHGVYGAQFSVLYNHAGRELQGWQVGMINRAKRMRGPHSEPPTTSRAFQLGIINLSSQMGGTQIGVFNRTRGFRGTQVGLINLYASAPYKTSNNQYGSPIGLLNVGAQFHIGVSYSNLGLFGALISTGNCTNCTNSESQMPGGEGFQKHMLNDLIVEYDWRDWNDQLTWSVGYKLNRTLYNKHSLFGKDPLNKRYFLNYGFGLKKLNFDTNWTKDLSLLTAFHGGGGYRLLGVYFFGNISLNGFFHQKEDLDVPGELTSGNFQKSRYQVWPGYQVGIRL